MPEQKPLTDSIFSFRLENYEEVKNSLALLFAQTESLLKLNDPIVDKMMSRVYLLYAASKIYNPQNIIDVIDMSTLCFLSPLTIAEFIKNPSNTTVRDLLSLEVTLVAAASNNYPTELTSYEPSELSAMIIDENIKMYNEIIFLHTLRTLIDLAEPDERTALLFTTLDPLEVDNVEFRDFQWNGAVNFSLLLQLIWKNFAFFGTNQQEFILRNYLYSAIVVGVPVEYWIKKVLAVVIPEFDNNLANLTFLKAIENSNERVPINTLTNESRPVVQILPEYVSRVYSGDIKTLIQEKFIQDIYKGQPQDKKFSEWLRTLLQLYYNLRNKVYLSK